MKTMNYDLLLKLIKIPDDLDKSIKKETISNKVRDQIIIRDDYTCQVCGLEGEFGHYKYGIPGKLAIHHIIPNGKADMDNLIILCKYCHNAVHMLLYVAGKWRFIPMSK